MSLKPESIPPVPEETARVARAAFPRGNVLIQMRDALGTMYTDDLFADLFPTLGQPAEAPWRLARVAVFQFMEHVTDRQAADAVRSRLDLKYCLSLELTDAGFDHTVLSEFRARLVEHSAEERLLEAMLELLKSRGWLKARGLQRTDSTHVLIIGAGAESVRMRGRDDVFCAERCWPRWLLSGCRLRHSPNGKSAMGIATMGIGCRPVARNASSTPM